MSEWRECTLSSVADIQTGPFGSQLHASDYVEYGIPSIMPANIGENLQIDIDGIARIRESDAERLGRYLVVENDIVYSRRGDVEKCAFITTHESGWLCGTGCLRVRFTSDAILPKYCAYYLTTDEIKAWVSANAVGSTMPNLNSTILGHIPMLIPPLPTQQAIAEVLSSLDDKISLLTRQNATLESLAQTYFRQWFVERASEEGKLGDYITLFDSKRIPLSSMEREKKKDGALYPYYGAASIMDYINAYIFDGEYILLGEDGTVETAEGYPVLQYVTGKFWCNNHAHVIQAKPPFTNYTLWCFLRQCSISHIVTGAVQPKINQENLKSLDIPLITMEDYETINAIAEELFKKIIMNNAQIQTLQKLRDALLPKLVSGEVKVKGA